MNIISSILWTSTLSLAIGFIGLASGWVSPHVNLCTIIFVCGLWLNRRQLWCWPLLSGMTVCTYLLAESAGFNPPVVVAIALALGGIWAQESESDPFIVIQRAFLSGGGLGAALWILEPLLSGLSPWLHVGTLSIIAGLTSSVWALNWISFPPLIMVPSRTKIQRTLRKPYRAPVHEAIKLYQNCKQNSPDYETRKGLQEVAIWVYTLQVTYQRLQQQVDGINPDEIELRIQNSHRNDTADSFTIERRQATANHLARILNYRKAMEVEQIRSVAMVEYALAFLEEANASLGVAMHAPEAYVPEKLPTVLSKLRGYANEQKVQRNTSLEVGQISSQAVL